MRNNGEEDRKSSEGEFNKAGARRLFSLIKPQRDAFEDISKSLVLISHSLNIVTSGKFIGLTCENRKHP